MLGEHPWVTDVGREVRREREMAEMERKELDVLYKGLFGVVEYGKE